MKPGKSLDALIAEKVMGLKIRGGVDTGGYPDYEYLAGVDNEEDFGPGEWWRPVPPYSHRIEAAWTVVEKIRISGIHMFMDNTRTYRVHATNGGKIDVIVDAETAPHAICLAALKAVGYELKETK